MISGDPNNKLVMKATLLPGEIAEVKLEEHVGGNTKPLIHMSVNLGEKNFLKPTFKLHEEQLKALSSKIKTVASHQLHKTVDKLKEGAASLSKDGNTLVEKAKKSIPDANPSVQFYVKEASDFKKEISADKTLQNLGQLL